MLYCIKEHLDEDVVFIIDNSMPDIKEMVECDGIEEAFTFIHPLTQNKIIDKFQANYDFTNQIEKDKIALEEYDKDNNLIRHAETNQTLTYFLPREIKNILKSNGFSIICEKGSLWNDKPIDNTSKNMIFISKVVK